MNLVAGVCCFGADAQTAELKCSTGAVRTSEFLIFNDKVKGCEFFFRA